MVVLGEMQEYTLGKLSVHSWAHTPFTHPLILKGNIESPSVEQA